MSSSRTSLPKPSPMAFYRAPVAISASPAYLMSGAVATGSLVKFLRSPSLASTGWLAAGVAGAGLYYGAGETTKRGFEDGPWAAVAASSLCAATTLPTALRTLRPSPVILSAAALGVGAYYTYEGLQERW